jgi:hypothetical protein
MSLSGFSVPFQTRFDGFKSPIRAIVLGESAPKSIYPPDFVLADPNGSAGG